MGATGAADSTRTSCASSAASADPTGASSTTESPRVSPRPERPFFAGALRFAKGLSKVTASLVSESGEAAWSDRLEVLARRILSCSDDST